MRSPRNIEPVAFDVFIFNGAGALWEIKQSQVARLPFVLFGLQKRGRVVIKIYLGEEGGSHDQMLEKTHSHIHKNKKRPGNGNGKEREGKDHGIFCSFFFSTVVYEIGTVGQMY